LSIRSNNLTSDDLKAFKDAFKLIDQNSDGKLSIDEFLILFKSQQMNYSTDVLRKFVNIYIYFFLYIAVWFVRFFRHV
jgi:Ca2+-binding EF-hand superfamily protein